MEKTNFDFLCEDLKFMGFGEVLQAELKQGIENNMPSFELYFASVIDNDPLQAILYFAKPDPAGYYFFTKYKLCLKGNYHHFAIFKGKGVTVKEGFNLLSGRAVYKLLTCKNGQKYNTWLQLDLTVRENEGFKVDRYHESYGFDLEKTLETFPIDTPSPNWDFSMLLRSLERGNLQAAFLRENGENHRVHIEANPRDKTIIIHKELPIEKPQRLPGHDAEDHTEGDDVENALQKKRLGRKKNEGFINHLTN